MKQKINQLASRTAQLKQKAAIASVVGVSMLSAGAAHAELPAPVAAAFTAIEGNFTSMETLAWPVVATITGGFILVKLFKKFANKAT